MGYLCNIRKYYWITFFHAMIPAYVIERLFWRQRGINVRMVVYCEIIYAVTVILLEVPSGVLADRFGKKRMLVIWSALSLAEFALLLFAHAFWQFALAVFLAGIGKAFSSGSGNALLYDSLLAAGQREAFEKHLGRIRAIDLAASLAAALFGGVLANWFPFTVNYIVSVVGMGAALIVTLCLREPPGVRASVSKTSKTPRYTCRALRVFLENPLLLRVGLTGAVLGACYTYLDEFWQLLAEAAGVPLLLFGVLGAALLGAGIPGSLLAYKLKGKIRRHILLSGILIVHAVGYLLIFLLRNTLFLIPLLLVSLTAGIADPILYGTLHHHTESGVCATTESIYSLMTRVMAIGAGLLFGAISAGISLYAGFLLLAVISFLYWVVYSIISKRLPSGMGEG